MTPPLEPSREDALREKTLGAFRRHHGRRKAMRRTVGGLAIAFLLVTGIATLLRTGDGNSDEPAGTPVAAVEESGTGTGTPPDERAAGPGIAPLSDEELLAAFPDGACFIALVDDRKVLIFRDPELRAQFAN